MPYNPALIGHNIKRLSDEFGSQRRLAQEAGLDNKTIHNAINSAHGLKVETAWKIEDAAGISLAELLGEAPIDPEMREVVSRIYALRARAEGAALPMLDQPGDSHSPTDTPEGRV